MGCECSSVARPLQLGPVMQRTSSNRLSRLVIGGTLSLLVLPLLVPRAARAETEGDRRRRLERQKRDKVIKPGDMVKWQAEPGRQRIGPMKPAWCDLTTTWKGKVAGKFLGRKLGQVKRYGLNDGLLVDVTEALCAHPNQPTWRKQTGYVVQKYANETGLGKKDIIASIRARLHKAKWKRDKRAFCRTLPLSPEAGAEAELLYRAKRRLYDCPNHNQNRTSNLGAPDKMMWYLDRGTTPSSELMRALAVRDCLTASEQATGRNPARLGVYAVCGLDARRLNRPRLEAELAKAPHNSYSRTRAREAFGEALVAGGRFKRAVDALVKRDPTYKKVFYTAPEAGWSKWVADYKANKQHIDAALAFEKKLQGPSRRALAGCRTRLATHLTSYLHSKRIRTKKQLLKIATNTVSGWLVGGLVWCNGVEGNRWEGHVFARILRKVRNARGPRAAATYAVIDAINDIRNDRSRFPITPRAIPAVPAADRISAQRKLWARRGLRASFIVDKGKGTVRRVRKTRRGLRITFKRTRVKEKVVNCRRTNRVWKIESSGRVEYFRTCKTVGSKWVDTTPKPVVIPRYAAAGIRPGRYMHFVADMATGHAKSRIGYPTTVYRSKRKKRVVAAFGFKL